MSDRRYNKPEIVVVDDDPSDLTAITTALSEEYIVHAFLNPRAAEKVLESRPIEAAVLDLRLPGNAGISTLLEWKRKYPLIETVFCSGESRLERALECLRRGAADFVPKPFRTDEFLAIIRNVREKRTLRMEEELKNFNDPNARPIYKPTSYTEFIGSSRAAEKVRSQIKMLRRHDEVSVMIVGESGTGKEVVAQMIHHQENSQTRPFISINMAALPATLVEAELFGVEKGAFTDAKQSRPGKFELAHRGDLFLDEMGDLSIEAQAKLLRVLQDGIVQRVGGSQPKAVRFRVIAATNKNLAEMAKEGTYREDLIFRISDVVVKLPPLRDRKEDIPELVDFFLKKHAPTRELSLTRKVRNRLMRYSWPGNVRQLESTIKRALVFNKGSLIREVDFQDNIFYSPILKPPSTEQKALAAKLSHLSDALIEHTARKHIGNRKAAWKELGISRSGFYKKLATIREKRRREARDRKSST